MSERDTPVEASPAPPSDQAAAATGSCRQAGAGGAPTTAERALDAASTSLERALRIAPLGGLGPLSADGQAMPIFATLNGSPVAVLDLDMYRRLVLAALDGIEIPKREKVAPAKPPFGLSTIERDPEVAEFCMARFRGGVTVQQIRDACRDAFGEDRTPSHARIQRFRKALARCR